MTPVTTTVAAVAEISATMAAGFRHLTIEVKDHIGFIRLGSGEQNPLNDQSLAEIVAAHDLMEKDPEVWGVIFTSAADGVFSTGLDAGFMLCLEREHKLDMFRQLFEATRRIYAFSKPELVLLPGHAFAAGAVLAMAADWRFMAEGKGRMAFPEVMLGISMPEAMIRMIASQAGEHNMSALIQTGDMFKGEDCLKFGIVNEIVPRDSLQAHGEKFMRRLFQKPLAGIRAVKRNLRRENLKFFDNDPSLDAFAELMGENFEEALRSGVEGRRPKFVNP